MSTLVSGLIQINKRNVDSLRPILVGCRNEVLINLDTFVERSQMASDSDELKAPSFEDKYFTGASLHPAE